VNSCRVSNHVLQHEDVISVGQHGVKFIDPQASTNAEIGGAGFEDTVIMKNLQDFRRLLAKENTVALPVPESDSADTEAGRNSA
jgi:hypothetical protein